MADRRNTDITKLTFTWQVVIVIVSTTITAYASQWQIRSDVRDILTRIELGAKVEDAQSKLQTNDLAALKSSIEAQSAAMKESIAAIQRRQEMQQIQISQLSEAITKLSTQQGRK